MIDSAKLQKMLEKKVDNKLIFGNVLQIADAQSTLFEGAAGNISTGKEYFIASTTKLYTTALILKLCAASKLHLDDKLGDLFDATLVRGLNTYRGSDYSAGITVKQLLAHTSGIPDYFSGRQPGGKSLEQTLTSGSDKGWSFEESLQLAKQQTAKFVPGQKGKALYSDTNFQLLGKILEVKYGKSTEQIFQEEIFGPLALSHTYSYTQTTSKQPLDLYYKSAPLRIPLAMASFRADGGIVSTAAESMTFLRAFFQGKFFPVEYFDEMRSQYNRVMFPLQYGVGIMRFKLPRIFTMFRELPELLGHSGLSGAFAYYCPAKELYFSGTVNQIAAPSASYRLLAEVLMSI